MKKHKTSIFFIGMAMFLSSIILSITFYLWRQSHLVRLHGALVQRKHIFCELLKPEMDKQTVLKTIEEFGTFTYGEFGPPSEKNNNFTLIINYDDQNIAGIASVFLVFKDGKYVEARILRESDPVPLCDP